MGTIIKFFSGLLVILLGFFIFLSGIITVSFRIDADEFKSDVIAEIEDSNFNAAVINNCKQQAADNGYTLNVTNVTYDEDSNIQLAEVILTYNLDVPFFGISSTKEVRGIAR